MTTEEPQSEITCKQKNAKNEVLVIRTPRTRPFDMECMPGSQGTVRIMTPICITNFYIKPLFLNILHAFSHFAFIFWEMLQIFSNPSVKVRKKVLAKSNPLRVLCNFNYKLMQAVTQNSHVVLQLNYRKRGNPDKVDQSQSRRGTIDSNIFSSANEMLSTEQ